MNKPHITAARDTGSDAATLQERATDTDSTTSQATVPELAAQCEQERTSPAQHPETGSSPQTTDRKSPRTIETVVGVSDFAGEKKKETTAKQPNPSTVRNARSF